MSIKIARRFYLYLDKKSHQEYFYLTLATHNQPSPSAFQ